MTFFIKTNLLKHFTFSSQKMKAFYFVILFIIFLSLNLSSAAVLKKGKHLNGNKGTCYDNCKNPVYLINRQNGLTLDIWNDPTQDSVLILFCL